MHPSHTGNQLLDLAARIDDRAVSDILAHSRRVTVDAGAVLQAAGEPIQHSFFPIGGMLSLSWILEDGSDVTTLCIGRDGAVHASPTIDLERCPHQVVASLAGPMWQVRAHDWRRLLDAHDRIKELCTSYAGFVLARSHQALACQMKHDVESRLCGWLLDMHEWQDGQPIAITHQGLARLLSVRRTTVTLLARALQDAGIIAYSRGLIHVTDVYALRQASCECHKLRGRWPDTRDATHLRCLATDSAHMAE